LGRGQIFERVELLPTASAGQVKIEHVQRCFLAHNFCSTQDLLNVAAQEEYGTMSSAPPRRTTPQNFLS
jgi:hypothetical protein